ncbi:MAG: DUF2284 domain-containing protein [Candidatus Nanoarchaeia archaeon]
MDELDIVLNAGKKFGVDEALVIYTSKIDVKDAIRYKAKFGELHDALNWVEPGYDIQPEEMRKLLREYTKAILVIGNDGKLQLEKFWEAMMAIEHALLINNYPRAFAMMSGPCRGCTKCTVKQGKTCADPISRRPSLEGVGIDIVSTVKRFKKNVSWGPGFHSIGLVLLE